MEYCRAKYQSGKQIITRYRLMRHKELDTSLICIYNLLNNCNKEKECVSIIEQLNKKIIQQTTFLQNFQNSLKDQFNFTNAIKQLPDINSHQNEINLLKLFEKHTLTTNPSTSKTFQSLISIFSSFSERNTLRSGKSFLSKNIK